MKLSHFFAAALVAAMSMVASNAHAMMYHVDGNFSGYIVSADITTANTLDAVGGYDITNITGTIGGYGSIAAITPNPNPPNVFGIPGFNVDNVYYKISDRDPQLDSWGVGFQMQNGVYANLWGGDFGGTQIPGLYTLVTGDYAVNSTTARVRITAVPLPAGILLFGSGIASLAGFAAKKKVRV